jgi:hypothetical protein
MVKTKTAQARVLLLKTHCSHTSTRHAWWAKANTATGALMCIGPVCGARTTRCVQTNGKHFDGKDIAKRSVDEMHRQSPLSPETMNAWLKALEALFPNVLKGQSLTGIYVPNSSAQFLFNNKPLGKIADAELAKRFFAIWLSPQTSAPELRKKLFAE